MNGLLHRLAARAAGTAAAVRSDARLPYGGGGASFAQAPLESGDEGSTDDAGAQVRVDARDALSPREPAFARTHGLTLAGASIEAAAEPATETAQRRARPPAGAAHASARAIVGGDVPLAAFDEAAAAYASRQPVPAHRSALPVEVRMSAAQSHSPRATLREPQRAPDSDPRRRDARAQESEAPLEPQHRAVAASSAHAADALAAPAPLLPPTSARAATATPTLAPLDLRPSRAPAAQAVDDATEVHIHIGRIEVTAVHEAAPPRPTPKARPAPMSLDAYLAARSRA